MKKLYTLFFALLLAGSLAAQNPTAYFMEGSTFRSQLNPAFAPLRGYVNIPGIGSLNVSTNGNISLDKVLYPRNGKLVTLIDSSVSSAEALSGLKTRNLLGADTYINLIGFGAYARNRKDFWSFGLSLRTSAEVNLPYSLFDFIKNGHEGSIRDIGVAVDSYLEAAFSYSFPLLDDRLYIGVRGKFLAGMARERLSFDRFDVSLQDDRWAVDAAGSLDISASGLTVTTEENAAGEQIYHFDDIELQPTSPAGYGFAVDLGATYDILPDLQASLAVNDLGFISWGKGNNLSGTSSKNLEFTGTTVEGGTVLEQPDFDLDVLEFRKEEARSATRALRNPGAPRLGERRPRIPDVAEPRQRRRALLDALLGIQDPAQHHRRGELPPDLLVPAHGKLLGDRQPRRRIRAGAEPLSELDQLLRRHRHTDGQTHAPMGADQTELDERHARAGHTDRQTRTAPPSRLLLRRQIVRRITTANHAPRISLDWEVRGA